MRPSAITGVLAVLQQRPELLAEEAQVGGHGSDVLHRPVVEVEAEAR
jgi:hypothetical protein